MGFEGLSAAASLRFQPPAADRTGLIRRPRLAEVLAGRFERRLTVLVAPGGYGKSTLLAQCIQDADGGRGAGQDIWLGCAPDDASAPHLAGDLLTALGRGAGDGDAARSVVDAVWSFAPEPVALVLDDVHHLVEGSTGAMLLGRLVDELPVNGHLVLAGRTPPPVPLARLQAIGGVMVLDDSDLRFDDTEVAEWAEQHDLPPSAVAGAQGWPALLSVQVGPGLAGGSPLAEVLADLDADRREAISRLCLFEEIDDELVAVVTGSAIRAADLVGGLPLCEVVGDRVRLHDLWRDAVTPVADAATRSGVRAGIDLIAGRGRFRAAFDVAERVDDREAMAMVAETLALTEMPDVSVDDAVHVLDRLPAGVVAEGYRSLLRATTLLGSDAGRALAVLGVAAGQLRSVGDLEGEAVAVIRQVMVHVWQLDAAALTEPLGRLAELATEGNERAAKSLDLTAAYARLIAGEPTEAMARVVASGAREDPFLAPLARLLVAHAHLDLGQPVRAERELEVGLVTASGRARAAMLGARLEARFIDGLPPEADYVAAQAELERRLRGLGVVENLALGAAGAVLMALRYGRLADARRHLAEAEELVGATVGVRARIATGVAAASVAVDEGDEPGAARVLRALVADVPLHRRPDRAYLRVAPMLYALVPEAREHLDRAPLGPAWERGRAIGAALVAARQQDDIEPAARLDWDRPDRLRAVVGVPHLVELAVAATAGGVEQARALLAELPGDVRGCLRALAAGGGTLAGAAADLLAEVPGRPTAVLEAALLGPLELRRDGVVVDDARWRRERVRSLLALLADRREVTRLEAALALWPDLDQKAALNNLRVNLGHLQRVLQPDRPADEPPWVLRVEGDRLRLVVDEWLRLDVDAFEAEVERARRADEQATPALALEHHLAAVARYRGDYLDDGPDPAGASFDRVRLRSAFVASAVRAGELLLAAGAPDEARDLAERALAAEPLAEPAHRLLVAALRAAGDESAADDARRRAAELLRADGLEPESGGDVAAAG